MRPNRQSQFAISELRIHGRRLTIAFYVCISLFFGILFSGCSSIRPPDAAQDQKLAEERELSEPYDRIVLKKSLTIDALPKISRSKDEYGLNLAGVETVSHSDRVVASLGQSEDDSRTWFNMVTFHEFNLNVVRKYFFVVDDRTGNLRARSRRGFRFDCGIVLGKEVNGKSHTSENTRRIANKVKR